MRARPLLKINLRPHFFLLLFRLFFSETPSRRCRLCSRTTSDPAQKSGKFHAKIAFFLFFRRKIWHDFVTPFSTFANIKGSLPTKSNTPDRLRCRTRRDGVRFSARFFIFLFQHRQKEVFSKVPASSPDQHSKRSPWPDFCERGVIFRATNAGKKKLVLARRACIGSSI